LVVAPILISLALFGGYLFGQEKSGFPVGYDAVQAAPNSHKVIFENALVRVLEVDLPPGATEPFHHHRWQGFFIDYDTGGRTPHIRYHLPNGTVKDSPSKNNPVSNPGHWTVSWLDPEPMHAVENADTPADEAGRPKRPPWVRVEIKCRP
jgi:hypothetical protein